MNQPEEQPWTLNRIEEMRKIGVEESLTLDYKAAAALDRNNPKISIELTKDVSAFANSSGGVLVYGVSEDSTNKHRPGELDPISRAQVSKEWLESIILTIQPRIPGVRIHPISIGADRAIYIVEIPQSSTAHQARDHKYYKRANFSSQPMEDYEIRDVMNRSKHPRVTLSFELIRYTPQRMVPVPTDLRGEPSEGLSLKVYCENIGLMFAQYVFARIGIPTDLVENELEEPSSQSGEIPKGKVFILSNQMRDRGDFGRTLSEPRYEPILPTFTLLLGELNLDRDALLTRNRDLQIIWQLQADNAPIVSESIYLRDIPIIDKRLA